MMRDWVSLSVRAAGFFTASTGCLGAAGAADGLLITGARAGVGAGARAGSQDTLVPRRAGSEHVPERGGHDGADRNDPEELPHAETRSSITEPTNASSS